MNVYFRLSAIIAAIIAILTFAVSIPVNLLGTSLLRAGASFLFFFTAILGVRWLFNRFGTKEEHTVERDHPSAGSQVDLQTPEDNLSFDDIFSTSALDAEEEAAFEPLSVPQVDAKQAADVIHKRSLDNHDL